MEIRIIGISFLIAAVFLIVFMCIKGDCCA